MVTTRKRQAATTEPKVKKRSEKLPVSKDKLPVTKPSKDIKPKQKVQDRSRNNCKQVSKTATKIPCTRLRKKKTVNYLELSQEESISNQHINNEVGKEKDVYEFDSDSENVKKRKKNKHDDSTFVVKTRPIKNNSKKPQRKPSTQKENRQVKPKPKAPECLKSGGNKLRESTNLSIIRVRPNANSTMIKHDNINNEITEFDRIRCTNLSIMGRRPNANSTMIERNDNAPKRQPTEHVIIEDEHDNDWLDNDNSDIGIYNTPQIEELEIANSTMINKQNTNKLSENKSLKEVQIGVNNNNKKKLRKNNVQDKENISPNVKIKKKTPKKNGSLLNYFKPMPSQDKVDLKGQDRNSSEDDDDGWFNFDCFRAEKNYTNSTNRQRNVLAPWRFNGINIKHNPHFLALKQSALPNINQEMVVNHAMAKKMGERKEILSDETEEVVGTHDVKLFEDFGTPCSDEEIENIDYEIDAIPVKKSKFKWKDFLNDDPPKKTKDVRTKAEEAEAEKWAEAFNSMCKEVEEFPLEIE